MRLLDRYLLRQLVAPFLFAVAALTSIMLLNQVAKRFGALVGKGLPWTAIAEVFALSLPFILAITIPMAVLMAVLYAFTHLASDNEVTAMRASGISVVQLVAPVMGAGLLMTLFTFAFNDQVLPRSNAQLRNLMINIGRKKPTFELREQVINDMGPAGLFLRASRIESSTGRLRDVTIYDMAASSGRRIVYADSGLMAMMANQTDLSLRLFSGSIHQFKAEDPAVFQLTHFGENNIRVKDITNQFEKNLIEASRGDREMSTCEMLSVIRGHQRDIRQGLDDQAWFLRKDLRALMGLADPARPPPPPLRPAGLYCGWFGGALLPKTVEAQAPAQDTARPPRLQPPRFLKKTVTDSGGPAAAAPQGPPPITALPGRLPAADGISPIRLVNWGEVANAGSRVEDARREMGRYGLEVHKKWSISVSCLVFVLVGVPMALRFPRGGMGLVLGGGLGVFAVYYVGLIAGEALGDRALVDPVAVMWFSNAVFALLGIIGLYRVSRDAGSTRGGDLGDALDRLRRRLGRRRAA